ncbi:MAG TPA: GntR family transcriptional regulator [Actinomycetales bacterium]|nr:GntR family transcriptional regulator [Actinomycetales bacterium]
MARQSNSQTLSELVRGQLHHDILSGVWSPGDRLQLTALSERYETSSTVVREALTRLVGERLVELRPNRGFTVPTISLEELRDLTEMRCVNEALGVKLATERGDLDWESELIAVNHRLERAPEWDTETGLHSMDWNNAHRDFHLKLIEPSGIPILYDLCGTLFDLVLLYGRWSDTAGRMVGRDIAQEHRAIMDAAINRKGDLAAKLLREHYETTLNAVVAQTATQE